MIDFKDSELKSAICVEHSEVIDIYRCLFFVWREVLLILILRKKKVAAGQIVDDVARLLEHTDFSTDLLLLGGRDSRITTNCSTNIEAYADLSYKVAFHQTDYEHIHWPLEAKDALKYLET